MGAGGLCRLRNSNAVCPAGAQALRSRAGSKPCAGVTSSLALRAQRRAAHRGAGPGLEASAWSNAGLGPLPGSPWRPMAAQLAPTRSGRPAGPPAARLCSRRAAQPPSPAPRVSAGSPFGPFQPQRGCLQAFSACTAAAGPHSSSAPPQGACRPLGLLLHRPGVCDPVCVLCRRSTGL